MKKYYYPKHRLIIANLFITALILFPFWIITLIEGWSQNACDLLADIAHRTTSHWLGILIAIVCATLVFYAYKSLNKEWDRIQFKMEQIGIHYRIVPFSPQDKKQVLIGADISFHFLPYHQIQAAEYQDTLFYGYFTIIKKNGERLIPLQPITRAEKREIMSEINQRCLSLRNTL